MGDFDEKYYDVHSSSKKPTAIQIGVDDKIFKGKDVNHAFAVASQERLKKSLKEVLFSNELPDCALGEQIQYLEDGNTTYACAGVINDAYNNSNDYNGYTDSSDNQLSLISNLLKKLGSKIYMVTLGVFTHGNQTDTHKNFCSNCRFSQNIL